MQYPFYRDFLDRKITAEEAIARLEDHKNELLKNLNSVEFAVVRGHIIAFSRYADIISHIPVAQRDVAFVLCSELEDAHISMIIRKIGRNYRGEYSYLAPLIARLLVDNIESRFNFSYSSDYLIELFLELKDLDPALAIKIAPKVLQTQNTMLIQFVIEFLAEHKVQSAVPLIRDILISFLKNSDEYGASICIRALSKLRGTSSIPLLRELLKQCDVYDPRPVQLIASALIVSLATLTDKDSIPYIAKFLDSYNNRLRQDACVSLGYLYAIDYVDKLTDIMNNDPDYNVRRRARQALKYIKSTHEGEYDLRKHLLYMGQPESFFKPGFPKRAAFEKTGSETILLGGAQAGKAIIRIVDEIAFKAWLQALSSDVWKKYGFDYVPVEPILRRWDGSLRVKKIPTHQLSIRPRSAYHYRVFTKVLGPPMKLYIAKHPEHREVLLKYTEAIKKLLKKIGIEHGHTHDFNFCVDTSTGKPRLYVIDFDQAERKVKKPLPTLKRPTIEDIPKPVERKESFLDKVKKFLRAG